MIRIWNDRKLAREFGENKVSEKEKLVYFLLFQVCVVIMPGMLAMDTDVPTTLLWISIPVQAVVTVSGYLWCYKSNEDGRDFTARCICLGLPVVSRMLVYILLPIFLLTIGGYIFFDEEVVDRYSQSEIAWEVVGLFGYLVFFMRLNSDIKLIQRISIPEKIG